MSNVQGHSGDIVALEELYRVLFACTYRRYFKLYARFVVGQQLYLHGVALTVDRVVISCGCHPAASPFTLHFIGVSLTHYSFTF